MNRTIRKYLRALLLILFMVALIAPSACGSTNAASLPDDDQTSAPTAFVSNVDGRTYCAWVNTPHEVDQGCGNPVTRYPAAPFPIPTDQPVREPGMSDGDYLLLGALFGYGLGHHSYFYSDRYYHSYIGPAYSRYPGYVSYGYGRRPLVRYSSVNVYHNTVIQHVDTKYAAQEKTFAADPKTGGYKTAGGKSYTGATAPRSAFSGTNVQTPGKRLGDAPTQSAKPPTPATQAPKPSNTSPGVGKPRNSSPSPSSPSRSGSSSGHSGGGHR